MQLKQTGYDIFRHFIAQWKWKMGFLIDLISWLNKHTTHLNKEDGVYPTKNTMLYVHVLKGSNNLLFGFLYQIILSCKW